MDFYILYLSNYVHVVLSLLCTVVHARSGLIRRDEKEKGCDMRTVPVSPSKGKFANQ